MANILLYSMIFCHVIADYNLQGCLASMKQRSWWAEHHPEPMYENDYITALWMHSFAWSFMIHVPVIALLLWKGEITWQHSATLSILLWTNLYIHEIIDTLKANSKVLNLWQDQLIHMIQIIATWAVWVYVAKIV